MDTFLTTLEAYSLLTAMALVGLIMFVGYALSKTLTSGRVHGSAVAIFIGLVIAYFAGVLTGGKDGIADITIFAGIGLLGGSMLRDFAIVSTAFGADVGALKRAGWAGVLSILIGVLVSFAAGVGIAVALV